MKKKFSFNRSTVFIIVSVLIVAAIIISPSVMYKNAKNRGDAARTETTTAAAASASETSAESTTAVPETKTTPASADTIVLTASTGTNAAANSQVTLTVSGASAGSSYRYIVQNGDEWAVIQDSSSNSSVMWNAGPAGTKTVYADVTDASGNTVRVSIPMTVGN